MVSSYANTSFLFWAVTQGIYSRPPLFDSNQNQILTVEGVVATLKRPGLWLNIQVNLALEVS